MRWPPKLHPRKVPVGIGDPVCASRPTPAPRRPLLYKKEDIKTHSTAAGGTSHTAQHGPARTFPGCVGLIVPESLVSTCRHRGAGALSDLAGRGHHGGQPGARLPAGARRPHGQRNPVLLTAGASTCTPAWPSGRAGCLTGTTRPTSEPWFVGSVYPLPAAAPSPPLQAAAGDEAGGRWPRGGWPAADVSRSGLLGVPRGAHQLFLDAGCCRTAGSPDHSGAGRCASECPAWGTGPRVGGGGTLACGGDHRHLLPGGAGAAKARLLEKLTDSDCTGTGLHQHPRRHLQAAL